MAVGKRTEEIMHSLPRGQRAGFLPAFFLQVAQNKWNIAVAGPAAVFERDSQCTACFIPERLQRGIEQKVVSYDAGDRIINIAEHEESNHKSNHGIVGVAAQPVEIVLCPFLAHENHYPGAAVERWRGNQIEDPEKKIQREERIEDGPGKVTFSGVKIEANEARRESD